MQQDHYPLQEDRYRDHKPRHKCLQCGHVCPNDNDSDNNPNDSVTSGSNQAGPPNESPPPYEAVPGDTGPAGACGPEEPPPVRDDEAPKRRQRLREYQRLRELVVDEVRMRWRDEWEEKTVHVLAKWVEDLVAVDKACDSWWMRAQGCRLGPRVGLVWYHDFWLPLFRFKRKLSVCADCAHARGNLEREMLATYRERYGPLIKQLEQEYELETSEMGSLVVIIGGRYGQKLRIRAAHAKQSKKISI